MGIRILRKILGHMDHLGQPRWARSFLEGFVCERGGGGKEEFGENFFSFGLLSRIGHIISFLELRLFFSGSIYLGM